MTEKRPLDPPGSGPEDWECDPPSPGRLRPKAVLSIQPVQKPGLRGVLGVHFQKADLPPPPTDLLRAGLLLMRCVSGSQAYGMATETSDVDIRGIFVPTLDYMLGFMKRVEQIEAPETTIYALQKYMGLAASANPNILELLFVPDDCLLEVHPLYRLLVDNRKLFLSKKVRWSYNGYAAAQIHRIELHRRYLMNPPKKVPRRSDYGLPEGESLIPREQIGAFYVTLAHILKRIVDTLEPEMHVLYRTVLEIVESEAFPGWEGLVQSGGIPNEALPYVQKLTGATDNFILVLQHEQAFYRAADEWNKYQNWLKQRNPARAALEAKYGYDSKHASHAIRLVRQGEEIMRKGELLVRLPDAEKVRAIRDGIWFDGEAATYEKVKQFVTQKEQEMQAMYTSKECLLPKEPDRKALDELCIEVVCKANEVPWKHKALRAAPSTPDTAEHEHDRCFCGMLQNGCVPDCVGDGFWLCNDCHRRIR